MALYAVRTPVRLTPQMQERRGVLAERLKEDPSVENPFALATSIIKRKRLKDGAKKALAERRSENDGA